MFFLVNASPPKLLGIATSNFAGAQVTGTLASFHVTLTYLFYASFNHAIIYDLLMRRV